MLLAGPFATADSDATARRAGQVLVDALVGSLLALGVEKLMNRRMPLAAFVLVCLVGALVLAAIAAAGRSWASVPAPAA